MLNNDWVLLSLLGGLVACGGNDPESAITADEMNTGSVSAASGGSAAGAGTPSTVGSGGGASGSGGAMMGNGGEFSSGGMLGDGGAAGSGAANGRGGTVGMESGGVSGSGGGVLGGSAGSGGGNLGGSAGKGGGGTTGMGGGSAAIGSGGTGVAGNGTAGAAGSSSGGANGTPDPVCVSSLPDEFEPNTSVGGGGDKFKDSPHFRVYGNASTAAVDGALNHLEAAFSCFVDDWCFKPTGLSVHSDNGPLTKMNIYTVGTLGGAGGVMQYDARAGLPYLEVLNNQVARPQVTVHEWGHAMTLTEYNWVEQGRTGAWWETLANWVADTYLTSSHCEAARNRFGVAEGNTIINLNRVIGESHLLIVSTQNYYEAWPLLTYLTSNPDQYAGLGKLAVQDLMRRHPRNNETPLHVLERIAAPVRVQTILGRYWARMAYLDIGHPRARDAFFDRRARLDFNSLEPIGNQTYRVKESRRPQYGGANIIPLQGTGDVSVQVTNSGNGLAESNFTATLSIRAAGGAVRYVDLPDGSGQASVGAGEEATLVVVNTPDTLYQYDAFRTEPSSPEAIGLNYQVKIIGAAP